MTKNRQISQTGIFLKNFRMERGEYQKGMAEKLRVSSPYLSAVESDKQIYRKPLKGATKLQNDLVTTVLVHALDLQDEYCERLINAVERFSNSRA